MEIIKPETRKLIDEKIAMAEEVSLAIAQAREAGIELPGLEERNKNAGIRLVRMRAAFFGE